MKIGIDLDGVIFDTEKTFRVYSELYDMLELKQNSKENNYELKLQDRFNWSEEQINDFFNKYFFEAKDKAKICQDEGVFVMIDDSLNICKSVSSEKIHSIYLKDAPSSETKDSLYLKTLYNWGEIYRYLNENKKASDN